MLSGKKKITQNGQIIYENNSYQGAFNFNFSIGKNSLSVVQHGDKFELRINNQAFSHLYENKLTNQHFKADEVEGSYKIGEGDNDIDVDEYYPKQYEMKSNNIRKKRKNNNEYGEEMGDDDIQKAIELSVVTAQKEEASRIQEAKVISNQIKEPQIKQGGLKPVKQSSAVGGDNLAAFDAFDFDNDKDDGLKELKDEFVFNFSNNNVKAKVEEEVVRQMKAAKSNEVKKEVKQEPVSDLLDLDYVEEKKVEVKEQLDQGIGDLFGKVMQGVQQNAAQ